MMRKVIKNLFSLSINLKKYDWQHNLILIASIIFTLWIFYLLKVQHLMTTNESNVLSNILTANGIFSAILITYLFTRIAWEKERKNEVLKEAEMLSEKVLNFKRVLNKLTRCYNVWRNENSTKNLVDSNYFKKIDFYDYKIHGESIFKSKNIKLMNEFTNHTNYNGNETALYLAMVSLVKNRKNEKEIDSEIENDFEISGYYGLETINNWIKCDIFNLISHYVAEDCDFINFSALKNDMNFINTAISKINKKFEGEILNNALLKNISDEFANYYMPELKSKLEELNKGIIGQNSVICKLIIVSMVFGALLPFILLIFDENMLFYSILTMIVAALNSGILLYFILRFRSLINKELKFI